MNLALLLKGIRGNVLLKAEGMITLSTAWMQRKNVYIVLKTNRQAGGGDHDDGTEIL